MKKISGLFRFNKLSLPECTNVLAVAMVLAGVGLFTGCNKSKPPVVQAPASQDTNQAADNHMPVYQPPAAVAPAPVAVQTQAEPDLGELQRSLIRWIVGNRRSPKNFADFAATAGVPIPPPPAGKQYFIDKTMHIQLVDR